MRLIKKINVGIEKNDSKKLNGNLKFLLSKRFVWMKKFINNKKTVIEIGSGNGLIKQLLSKKIITSDIELNKNVDKYIDMNKLHLSKKYINKVDVFIFNHSIHHSSNPIKTLNKLQKYLKKDGLVLMNEPEISFFFKLFLYLCNHEGWDLDLKNKNKKKFWYENNATSRILFGKKKVGNTFNKNYVILHNVLNEFFIFLNSGGNSVNSPHIKLNKFLLKFVDKFDDLLIYFFPKIFALNRSIVLRKNEK